MQNCLTKRQYDQLCADRGALVKRMLQQSLIIPEGYVLTDDSRQMFANSILAIRPAHTVAGSKMINFIHQITHRSSFVNGEFRKTPVEESIRAVGDKYSRRNKKSVVWEADARFGIDGLIVSIVDRGYADSGLAASVRELVSQVSSQPPFVNFEWRRCPHDPTGKLELFDGEQKLQDIWKSYRTWGTRMGSSCDTMAQAKIQAEVAATAMLRSRHEKRLASLDDVTAREGLCA